jgi:Xaa-Pro dipeptidase
MKEYIPHFSDTEYERRYRLVKNGMEESNIDCLLVPVSENLTYLTNISMVLFGFHLLFPRVGDPTLFANPVIYRSKEDRINNGPLASRYSGAEESRTLEDSSVVRDLRGVMPPNFGTEIAKWTREHRLEHGTIGIAGREVDRAIGGGGLLGTTGPLGLKGNLYNELTDKLPDATFTDGTQILSEVRAIKSAEEIDSIRNAARIADLCGEAIVDEMKRPGVKEADLFAVFWDTLYRNDGAYAWFFKTCITQTAKPTGSWHLHPYNYTLQGGDIFFAELLPAWKDGYVSGLDVSFVLSEPAQVAAYEKMDKVCLGCYNAVVSCLGPGATPQEILKKGDKPIADAGFMRGAPLLYGIGLYGMEPPFIGFPEDPYWPEPVPLKSGMTVKVISHVYDQVTNVCVRTGSTHLITDTGSECLNNTSFPRGLVRIMR